MNSKYLLKCSYPSKYKTKRGRHVRLFSDPPPRTHPTIFIQVEHYYYFSSLCMRMRENEICERVCGGPMYVLKGRFPPSSDMETLITAFGRIRKNHRPKCTWTSASLGSAEPGVRPVPWHRLSPPSLAGRLTCGSSSQVCVGRGLVHRFALTNGPFL